MGQTRHCKSRGFYFSSMEREKKKINWEQDFLYTMEKYCQLKKEALDRTMWRNRFGRGFGPVLWQITDDDDDKNRETRYTG